MKQQRWFLAALLAAAIPCTADDLPPDAMVDMASPSKTLAPKVVHNSGRLEWVPYQRDLTPWVSLSHEDKRSAQRPRKVDLVLPLHGDPQRGRAIAMDSAKGNCVTCHELPGDDWPGTFGNSLLHYGKHKYSDAKVYQQIFDARVINPYTVMPPFGTHGLLSDQDIRDLVAFVQSIQ